MVQSIKTTILINIIMIIKIIISTIMMMRTIEIIN